ncbi:hypothetical protein AYO22_11683 [Fonsecaea multimorphosa]|nr:hypothetical protein AYO22_11683 [Fonsecaea multimorphosa]
MRSGLLQCSLYLARTNELSKGFPPPPPPSPPLDHHVARKHEADQDQPDCSPPPKRVQSSHETAEAPKRLDWWLSTLASGEDLEDPEIPKVAHGTSGPTPARSRSQSFDSWGRVPSQSRDGSESQDENAEKSRKRRNLDKMATCLIGVLSQQYEDERENADRERRAAEERETLLLAQLEQQQKKSEEQQNKLEQQVKELQEILKEQREENKRQRAYIEQLLQRTHS